MAKTIMVVGTCSNAGKSLLAAGICRVLKQEGYDVAPFKAQNMALNSYITKDGLEMGRAQAVQAEACLIEPDVRMNPVLLKPTSDKGSQVVLNGEVWGTSCAHDYHKRKEEFKKNVKIAFDSLASEHEVIVIEGAGAAAEINLRDDDIVNMGLAEMVDAPVILVGDIDRGGVFASIAGSMVLFSDEDRARVKGVVINKFRGALDILQPGIDKLEEIIKIPVLGVVPYVKIDIDDEDGITDRFKGDGRDALIDIAVIRLPKISNSTDINPLEYIDGVSVRYVNSTKDFGEPDLVVIPGTKNTMEDLLWLRQSGLEARILNHNSKGKPIFGICGGYQMLGRTLEDPYGVEHGGNLNGMGILPQSTIFENEKIRKAEKGILSDVTGIFAGLSGKEYEGYEIHMGVSRVSGNIINSGNAYGTYIHGIFDRGDIAKVIIESLLESKGIKADEIKAFDADAYKQEQYDKLADVIRNSLDVDFLIDLIKDNGGEKNEK